MPVAPESLEIVPSLLPAPCLLALHAYDRLPRLALLP